MPNDQEALKKFLSQYKRRDYTYREVLNLLEIHRSLTYRLEAFVFNNGTRKDLVNLEGTIPVRYKGAFYNIPVSIWLMDTHPQNAPLCYVKPTADMSIKVSKYVDSNGKIYLPYLHEWTQNGSTLEKLIQCMIRAFGELPPVYSKPRNEAVVPYLNPFPPRPSGYPFPLDSSHPQYPTYSEFPSTNASSSLPYPNFGTPYPGVVNTNGMPYPPATGSTPYPPATGSTPYPPATGSTPYPLATGSTPYPPAAGNGPARDTSGGTITEEHIKASLLSAVEDKLRRRLKEQSQQSQAELETLRRTQQELCDGKSRLEDILTRLQRERVELDKNVAILQEKEKELEAAVERLAEQEGIDVDEAVVTTAPLYSQLLNAFAEEATLEDAIYYMGEALRKEVIDLDTFLKQMVDAVGGLVKHKPMLSQYMCLIHHSVKEGEFSCTWKGVLSTTRGTSLV